jgi:hypothetical protein
LRGNKIKTLPEKFGNIIASHIFLDNNQIEPSWIYKKFKENVIEEDYIFCDGILTHLQGKKKVGKYTVYVGYFGFVATMDNKTFAHGRTIESAISDLRFKLSDRNTEDYIDIDINEKIDVEECIIMYRCITGACGMGVDEFLENIKLKKAYSVTEMIELTKDQYGGEQFANFFKN